MKADGRPTASKSHHRITVDRPFRLDLTVSVLRRLSTNVVDVLTSEGEYLRLLGGPRSRVIVRVGQVDAETLSISLDGNPRHHASALELVRRTLGLDRDLTHFDHAAARIPWLKPLARRMRGVRPPRYPSLWEACVNSIVFQQISLEAASTILRRMIVELENPRDADGVRLRPFPGSATVLDAPDSTLRRMGLSRTKLDTLRRLGESIEAGTLTEQMLEECPSADAAAILREFKGIGPWTATLILLRGLGRLDVFPGNDTSVARNLALVAGSAPASLDEILRDLSPQQGMLYYHLLLARLETRGGPGVASRITSES